ncbi:MAG: (2Fe-2S)-binding protein [Pseudomonadota bacterium]
MVARLTRLSEIDRASVPFAVDGQDVTGLAGDTIMIAMLAHRQTLRSSEFGPEKRAGFCLMGACQDCWVWTEEGSRLRACSTTVEPGMRLLSQPPEGWIW